VTAPHLSTSSGTAASALTPARVRRSPKRGLSPLAQAIAAMLMFAELRRIEAQTSRVPAGIARAAVHVVLTKIAQRLRWYFKRRGVSFGAQTTVGLSGALSLRTIGYLPDDVLLAVARAQGAMAREQFAANFRISQGSDLVRAVLADVVHAVAGSVGEAAVDEWICAGCGTTVVDGGILGTRVLRSEEHQQPGSANVRCMVCGHSGPPLPRLDESHLVRLADGLGEEPLVPR